MIEPRDRRGTLDYRIVTSLIRFLSGILCRIHGAEQLESIPDEGPLIVVMNHINFMEAPLLFTRLMPRTVSGFAKIESWDNPLLGYLGNLWNAIPLNRGEADIDAFKEALKRLEQGEIIMLAPEGTRSGHGRLQKGLAGVAFLALRAGVPVMPMVHYGGERFWDNLRRLRRTDFYIKVGEPFHLEARDTRVRREVREQMVDEVMYQMAAMLPEQYRGVYADLEAATEEYIRFPRGSLSNLQHTLD